MRMPCGHGQTVRGRTVYWRSPRRRREEVVAGRVGVTCARKSQHRAQRCAARLKKARMGYAMFLWYEKENAKSLDYDGKAPQVTYRAAAK